MLIAQKCFTKTVFWRNFRKRKEVCELSEMPRGVNLATSSEEKRKMIEILERFKDEGDSDGVESDDENVSTSLAERLCGVDLGK